MSKALEDWVFAEYIFGAVIMLLTFAWLTKIKSNSLAKILALGEVVAFASKGYALSSFYHNHDAVR